MPAPAGPTRLSAKTTLYLHLSLSELLALGGGEPDEDLVAGEAGSSARPRSPASRSGWTTLE